MLEHRHLMSFCRLQPLDHATEDQPAVLVYGGLDGPDLFHAVVQSVDLRDQLVSLLQQRVLDQEGELLFSVGHRFVEAGNAVQLREPGEPGCCAGRH